jgi:hypothetical protein
MEMRFCIILENDPVLLPCTLHTLMESNVLRAAEQWLSVNFVRRRRKLEFQLLSYETKFPAFPRYQLFLGAK